MRTKEEIAYIRKTFLKGTTIRLVTMDDFQAPQVGCLGTITGVDDLGDIMVSWENGSSLKVIYGVDEIDMIEFYPSINGFSIRDLKAEFSDEEDWYNCNLYYNGVRIAECDTFRGDDSPLFFHGANGFDRESIEGVVASFPSKAHSGKYNLKFLVKDLIKMQEIFKMVRKVRFDGLNLVTIDDWENGYHSYKTIDSDWSDEQMMDWLRGQLQDRGEAEYDVKRYRGFADLIVSNREVRIEELMR